MARSTNRHYETARLRRHAGRIISAAWLSFITLLTMPMMAHGLDQPKGVKGFPAPRLSFSEEELDFAKALIHDLDLASFYGSNGLRLIFTDTAGQARRAALLAAVDKASEHGLPRKRYQLELSDTDPIADELAHAALFKLWLGDLTGGLVDPRLITSEIKRKPEGADIAAALSAFAAAEDPTAALASFEPQAEFYLALKEALRQRALPQIPEDVPLVPDGVWRSGIEGPAVDALRQRLAAFGHDAPADQPSRFDTGLENALIAFQQESGLTADGIAGPQTITRLNGGQDARTRAILIAMERWRWLPEDLGPRHVWVNLPEFKTRIIRNGAVEFETRSIIGKAHKNLETPEFSDLLSFLVFNPTWHVPRSIIVNEYLPRLKANPHAVAHLDVTDQNGRIIPRDQIDFSRYDKANFPFRMQQKPSPDNALGRVKFMFPNQWDIYLHDTPTRWLFNQNNRAHSHGCIRIHDPMDLATALLQGQSNDPSAFIDRLLKDGREQWIRLNNPLPVHLVYFTTFPDTEGQIRHAPDIYGRDAPLWEALRATGLAVM